MLRGGGGGGGGGVEVRCRCRELSCNMAVQLGGLVDEAHNITWVHNMGSYLNTTTAQLYQFSIQYSEIELKQPLTCGRGRLVSTHLCIFHKNITCSIQNFPSRIEFFRVQIHMATGVGIIRSITRNRYPIRL